MKLLFCKNCKSIFSLSTKREKSCDCGEVTGKYIDSLNATYTGIEAVPLGFANTSFVFAVQDQPDSGWGEEFKAFVIPKVCPTFKGSI